MYEKLQNRCEIFFHIKKKKEKVETLSYFLINPVGPIRKTNKKPITPKTRPPPRKKKKKNKKKKKQQKTKNPIVESFDLNANVSKKRLLYSKIS